MNSFFAFIYDTLFGVYDQNYDLVYTHLFDNGGYTYFGLIFLLIPIAGWLLFYFVWNYPYGKFIHWLIWLLVVTLITMGATYGVADAQIFSSSNQELNDALAEVLFSDYCSSLPMTYTLINGLLAAIVGILSSLILKRFSKVQIHLPF